MRHAETQASIAETPFDSQQTHNAKNESNSSLGSKVQSGESNSKILMSQKFL